MKQRMIEILDNCHKYNAENLSEGTFGLSAETEYDALVVAPSYTPHKLFGKMNCNITTLREGSYIGGYLLEIEGMKIAWIKTSSGASNCIDHMAVAAELKFRKLIFVGAVGSLRAEFGLGELCTPTYSISGGYANTYLKNSLRDFVPFEKVEPDTEYVNRVVQYLKKKELTLRPASVFCTDSIALEYTHLEEIREFGTDLIEMETSSFYLMADLMEVPAIALLVVSDNSATGIALVGRTEEEQNCFNRARYELLPEMMTEIFKME